MDILSILSLLWRQKWVVAATAAVSVASLVFVVVKAPPVYRASSAVILLNPAPPPVPVEGDPVPAQGELRTENPYLRLNDLSIIVDIVQRIMESDPVADELFDEGLIGEYVVAANIDFYRGPIIDIAVEAPTERDAIDSTELVGAKVDEVLFNIQAAQDTDPQYFIHTDVVVPATRASIVLSSTVRRVIAVGALCGLLVLGSAIGADALGARRRRRRESEAGIGLSDGNEVATVTPLGQPQHAPLTRQSPDEGMQAIGSAPENVSDGRG